MAYDYTRCPEFAGAMTEPRPPAGDRWPEAGGPMTDYQQLAQGYGTRTVTVGPILPLLPPEVRDRERADCERRNLLRQQVQAAALTAARNALLAASITEQVFADTADAVERAVAAAPAGTETT